MKDYIKYKNKTYQVSTAEINGLFETMIFPVENGIVFGYEVYCYRTSNKYSSMYRHQEILNYPEMFVSSKKMLEYLRAKETDES